MRIDRSLVWASLLFLLQCPSLHGFAPSRILRQRAESMPLVSRAKVWKDVKKTIAIPRKSPSALKVVPGLAAGIQALHSNTSYVLSAILWLSTFGVSLERRTTIGKALSAPLATMALALAMANIGLLPFQSPVCKFLGTKYVRLLLLVIRLSQEKFIYRLNDQSIFDSSSRPIAIV
jgi:hypothetical protein